MHLKFKMLLMVILIGLLISATSFARERIKLSVVEHPFIIPMISQTVVSAYRELGYSVQLEVINAARGLVESNAGRLDGELVRVELIETYAPNLLRVPVSLGSVKGLLICHIEVTCDISVIDDIEAQIGVLNGDNMMTAFMLGRGATTIGIVDIVALEDLLVKGRLKYALALSFREQVFLLNPDKVQIAPEPLLEARAYHYIHNKHSALLPALTRALKQSQIHTPIKSLEEVR